MGLWNWTQGGPAETGVTFRELVGGGQVSIHQSLGPPPSHGPLAFPTQWEACTPETAIKLQTPRVVWPAGKAILAFCPLSPATPTIFPLHSSGLAAFAHAVPMFWDSVLCGFAFCGPPCWVGQGHGRAPVLETRVQRWWVLCLCSLAVQPKLTQERPTAIFRAACL
jgi:hypothetical protein